jgi:hypothetical protein
MRCMVEFETIQVEVGPGRSHIQLPTIAPVLSFTRGDKHGRAISLVALAFAVLLFVLPWSIVIAHRPMPPAWMDIRLRIATIATFMFCVSLVVATCLGGGAAVLIRFFPYQLHLDADTSVVCVMQRQGPWRSKRRFTDIRALHIRPAATISRIWLTQPLKTRICRLIAEMFRLSPTDGLTYFKSWALGSKLLHIEPQNLESIEADPPSESPGMLARLTAIGPDGSKTRLVMGNPKTIRYLARTLTAEKRRLEQLAEHPAL